MSAARSHAIKSFNVQATAGALERDIVPRARASWLNLGKMVPFWQGGEQTQERYKLQLIIQSICVPSSPQDAPATQGSQRKKYEPIWDGAALPNAGMR